MILDTDVFKVGFLAKPHGLDGFVNFHYDCDVLDTNDYPYLILLIDGIFVPFCISEYRFKSENVALVKFIDIDNSEKALKYQSTEVYFPIEYQDVVEDTKIAKSFWQNCIGYNVYDVNNKKIGKITNVDEQTMNTLLELTTPIEISLIVPGVEDWIQSLDHASKKIIYILPDGLLDS